MIKKARKITCPVGEKYLPNWENKKDLKKEKNGAQENKTTTTILMARLFKINKSNENKTPSLETSRFAKSTLLKRKGKLLKGNGKKKSET